MITYMYEGKTYTNYTGNYWDDYTGTDADGDGIGDSSYSIPNDNDDNYPLMKPFEHYTPAKANPIVSISTDKYEYTTCETMNITIHLTNPTDTTQHLWFLWYLGFTDYDYWLRVMTAQITLLPSFDESFKFSIHIGDWGDYSFSSTWSVALVNKTTYEVICDDTADWRYMPSEMAHGETIPVEIGKEIMEKVGEVKIPS